jgi:hypothetical protein
MATGAAWLNGNNSGKGKKEGEKRQKKEKSLTLTGLLMEGLDPRFSIEFDRNWHSLVQERCWYVFSRSLMWAQHLHRTRLNQQGLRYFSMTFTAAFAGPKFPIWRPTAFDGETK